MLTKLKAQIQRLILEEARVAHGIGLKPNHVSALGVLAAVSSAYFYWSSQLNNLLLIAAALLLLVSGFLDALDGVLARSYEQATLFGGFLDSLLDRYADAMILTGILLGWLTTDAQIWLLVGIAAIIGSFLVSYSRARAEAAGVRMETVGIAERAERLLIIAIASFLSLLWRDALRWSILLLAVLTNLTVVERAFHFKKASHAKGRSATPVV